MYSTNVLYCSLLLKNDKDKHMTLTLHFCTYVSRQDKERLDMRFSLVCVRHGEAQHNLATPTGLTAPRWTDDGSLDTPLTPRGREQAAQVCGDSFISSILSSHLWVLLPLGLL